MNELQFANQTQRDGQAYYEKQAERNADNVTATVFRILAKDEYYHAEILTKFQNSEPYALEDHHTAEDTESLFAKRADYQNTIRAIPNQLDVYREALNISF